MFGFSNVFHPTTAGGGGVLPFPTFKIFCKADENFCLTVRDGDAVLAPADSSDEHQHWFKDKRFGTFVKDEEGQPAFSLVNKATGLAVQHIGGPSHPVKLVRFDPDSYDNTLMWTLSGDMGNDGYGSVRTLNDISLKLAAFQGDHSVSVKLSDSSDGDNQHWKILPWSDEAYVFGGQAAPTFRLYCKAADVGFSLTVRNGTVCLAPSNPHDDHQHWVEDTRYGDIIKDEDGYPAFALVNRATGDAIKQPEAIGDPVKLVPYDPHYLDMSLLWSKGSDIRHSFHFIRMVDNIHRNMEVCDKGPHNNNLSGVQDVSKVMLSKWRETDNQYWRMVPWPYQLGRGSRDFHGRTYARRRLKKAAPE